MRRAVGWKTGTVQTRGLLERCLSPSLSSGAAISFTFRCFMWMFVPIKPPMTLCGVYERLQRQVFFLKLVSRPPRSRGCSSAVYPLPLRFWPIRGCMLIGIHFICSLALSVRYICGTFCSVFVVYLWTHRFLQNTYFDLRIDLFTRFSSSP
jgi:hypothetical protein